MIFTIHCSLFIATAQDQHLVDSLETKLKTLQDEKVKLRHNVASINDTAEADILYSISKLLWGNNLDKSMKYARQSLEVSEKIGYKKGTGNAYNSIGAVNIDSGDYSAALEFHLKALKITKEIGYKKGIAASYNLIGEAFRMQGNYPEALTNYFAALKIRTELKDEQGIAGSYNNIGLVYTILGNYTEALKNYAVCVKLMNRLGNKFGIASCYNNMSLICIGQDNYPEALTNSLAALKIRKETGDKIGIATSYNNIGLIYKGQGMYAEAEKSYFSALEIDEEIGDKFAIATSYYNIGNIFFIEKKFKKASEYLNKASVLSKEIGSFEDLKDSYYSLSQLDSAQGNFAMALEHYKLYKNFLDSMVNNENTKKTIALQMTYDFGKKQLADSIKSIEEKKVITSELKQEQTKSYALYGGLALMVVFGGFMYNRFRVTNKQKKIITMEKHRSDELLLNILPAKVAEELKEKGSAEAQLIDEVTVLFTDFKGFTQLSEKLSPKQLVAEINECFSAFDHITLKYGIEKIKTIGDAYMAAGGLPTPNKTHAGDVVKAALEIQKFMHEHRVKKEKAGELFFEIRIGVHSGPVVAGIVGVKKFAYDIWGDTVNTASRMESSGEVGKVNISGSTYEMVKNEFNCIHRGKITAKGKGEVDMYFVE